jgi:hypothetical protein
VSLEYPWAAPSAILRATIKREEISFCSNVYYDSSTKVGPQRANTGLVVAVAESKLLNLHLFAPDSALECFQSRVLFGICRVLREAGMVEPREYWYSGSRYGSAFEMQSWITQRVQGHLTKAAECERLSQSTPNEIVKGMYFDLAQRWRDLAHEAESLDREHYRWFIDPHQ